MAGPGDGHRQDKRADGRASCHGDGADGKVDGTPPLTDPSPRLGSGLLADGMTALTVAVRTWTLVFRLLSRNLPGKAPCLHSTHARSEDA